MRTIGFFAVILGALTVSACGGGAGSDGSAARDAHTASNNAATSKVGAPVPTAQSIGVQGITVLGTGSVKNVPDVSEWSFGVHSEAKTAEAALRENSAATKRLLDALKRAGVDKKDLRTQQVSLWPDTRDGETVVGYTASNSVSATVNGIATAGRIVDAAVTAGANEVSGPTFRVSDSRAQYEEAAAAAFDDARRKAEAIAAKAGVSLGRPLAIAEASGRDVYAVAFAAEAARADVPIEPGQQEFQVALTVTFSTS
jgi:uncharacterized protein YggE